MITVCVPRTYDYETCRTKRFNKNNPSEWWKNILKNFPFNPFVSKKCLNNEQTQPQASFTIEQSDQSHLFSLSDYMLFGFWRFRVAPHLLLFYRCSWLKLPFPFKLSSRMATVSKKRKVSLDLSPCSQFQQLSTMQNLNPHNSMD